MSAKPERVAEALVLGFGNPLRGDDGIGALAIELLNQEKLPPGTVLAKVSTPGWDLATWLEGWRRVVIIDAVCMHQPPGTWQHFSLEDVTAVATNQGLSLHESGLAHGLAIAKAIGALPDETVVFGIEPASTERGQSLDPAVEAALPAMIKEILNELWKRQA